MKKVLLVLTLVTSVLILASCEVKPTLKVFMPNEYIDEGVIDAFEEAFDVRVDLITFDSNEAALPQVKVNRYDVVIPSDYAIEELALGGFLETIDWDLFDEISQSDLDPALVTLTQAISTGTNGFNILDYAVPYFWGNVGLLYDTTRVESSVVENAGWDILNTLDDDVMFYDSSRDMVMIALKALYAGNVDVNNPTSEQLGAAENWLIGSGRESSVTFASDEIFDDMLDPTRYAVAVSYSGDAVYLMSENENLAYFVPEKGSNVWIDGMVVPKNSEQKELAYAFINFISSYEMMYQNSEYIGYTAPRLDVVNALLAEEIYAESSYRMVVRSNDSVFRFNETNKIAVASLWARVRSE